MYRFSSNFHSLIPYPPTSSGLLIPGVVSLSTEAVSVKSTEAVSVTSMEAVSVTSTEAVSVTSTEAVSVTWCVRSIASLLSNSLTTEIVDSDASEDVLGAVNVKILSRTTMHE